MDEDFFHLCDTLRHSGILKQKERHSGKEALERVPGLQLQEEFDVRVCQCVFVTWLRVRSVATLRLPSVSSMCRCVKQ